MAKSKTVKAGDAIGVTNGIQDIAHEVIDRQEMVIHTPKVITVEDQIKLELAKFNIADSAIEQLRKNFGSLVISGPEDKEGYTTVREAWGEVRSKRTGLEKKGKELRDGYTVINRAISKEEDRLIYLLKPLEDDLYGKWKAVDDEKEKIKQEKQEAEQRELMARIEELQKFGMTLEGGFYSIGGTISVDIVTLRSMPEDKFLVLKSKAQAVFAQIEAEKAKEAEEKRQEQLRLESERKKLQEEKDELARQQAEMKKQRDELEKQQEAIKAEERRKVEEVEYKERERKENFIANALEVVGLKYNYSAKRFEFKNEIIELSVTWAQVIDLEDSKIADLALHISKQIEAAKSEEAEKQNRRQAEADQQARIGLKDAEIYQLLIEQLKVDLLKLSPKEFNGKLYQNKVRRLAQEIQKVIDSSFKWL